MELWIRSQDKKKLKKVDDLEVSCPGGRADDEWAIIVDNIIFARYKTEERALEVLDDIQNKIGQLNTGEYTTKCTKSLREVVTETNTNYKNRWCIYEMPKE